MTRAFQDKTKLVDHNQHQCFHVNTAFVTQFLLVDMFQPLDKVECVLKMFRYKVRTLKIMFPYSICYNLRLKTTI